MRGGDGEVGGCTDSSGFAHVGVGADLKYDVNAAVLREFAQAGTSRLCPDRGTVISADDNIAAHSLFERPRETVVHDGERVGHEAASIRNFPVEPAFRIAPVSSGFPLFFAEQRGIGKRDGGIVPCFAERLIGSVFFLEIKPVCLHGGGGIVALSARRAVFPLEELIVMPAVESESRHDFPRRRLFQEFRQLAEPVRYVTLVVLRSIGDCPVAVLCRIRARNAETCETAQLAYSELTFFIPENTVRVPFKEFRSRVDVDIEQYACVRCRVVDEKQFVFKPCEIELSVSPVGGHVP